MSVEESDAAEGHYSGSAGLMVYTGLDEDSAAMIYHDRDSLEAKFWKWMQYKVEQDQVTDWFSRRDQVNKGEFAKLVNNLEWHCNHQITGVDQQGQQLTRKQISHLLKCVVGVEKEVTKEMIEVFAGLESMEEVKAALQKHHNAICKRSAKLKQEKKQQQDEEDGTCARTAAAAARIEMVLVLPVILQVFGGPFAMLSTHSTHTLTKNRYFLMCWCTTRTSTRSPRTGSPPPPIPSSPFLPPTHPLPSAHFLPPIHRHLLTCM
jgi:hypothetical protein